MPIMITALLNVSHNNNNNNNCWCEFFVKSLTTNNMTRLMWWMFLDVQTAETCHSNMSLFVIFFWETMWKCSNRSAVEVLAAVATVGPIVAMNANQTGAHLLCDCFVPRLAPRHRSGRKTIVKLEDYTHVWSQSCCVCLLQERQIWPNSDRI